MLCLATDDTHSVTAKKSKLLKDSKKSKKSSLSSNSATVELEKASKSTELKKKPKVGQKDPDTESHAATAEEDGSLFSNDEEDDQAQALAQIIDSGEEDTSVDDELAFKEGQDVGNAPLANQQPAGPSRPSKVKPGVVYIGRIPHGFYEHPMRQYFEQFGPISRLRLSRNKKTGASKHFAFVEFVEDTTAEIVAKTMNNYLLFGHLLKCKVVPQAQVHEGLWKGANRRFKTMPRNKMEAAALRKPMSASAWTEKISREEKRRSRRAKKLNEMGYDFDRPKLKPVPYASNGFAAIEAGDDSPASPAVEENAPESVQIADEVEPHGPPADIGQAAASGKKKDKKRDDKPSGEFRKSSKTKKSKA